MENTFSNYTDNPIPESRLTEIKQIVSHHRTLENILTWSMEQNPPKMIDDMIAQDEFTIDVILRYDEDAYLVYDVT